MKSIVSYPDRGEGGKSSYRGNCSPHLIEDLIKQYHAKSISDFMVGGGTTKDVATNHGIQSYTTDLSQGFDMMNDDIPVRSELTFWHPPYLDIVVYSDVMYKAAEVMAKYGFDPRERDLSRIHDWDEFMKAINYCCLKQYSALEQGGRLAILMGDIKKKGRLYSMIREICCPGTLEQIVIKAQHNCVSDRTIYTNASFIPIVHEYVMIIRKDSPLIFDIQYTTKKTVDMRDINASTWRDVVLEVVSSFGGGVKLEDVYKAIDGHEKAKKNPHWKEKVRQTLQLHSDLFENTDRGVWQLSAA